MPEGFAWVVVAWCIASPCGLKTCGDNGKECSYGDGPSVVVIPDGDRAGCELVTQQIRAKSEFVAQSRCLHAPTRSIKKLESTLLHPLDLDRRYR